MKSYVGLIEEENRWILPLQQQEVTRCCIDDALSIDLLSEEGFSTIRIENRFLFRTKDHQTIMVSPEDQAVSLGPVFSVLHTTIDTAIAYKNGKLELRFSDGSSIEVESDQHYESWMINGKTGLQVVSIPGGNLSIWVAD